MRKLALACLLNAACGGRPPPPTPPPPLSPKELGALIFADFTSLAEIARRQLGNCTALTAELRPHIARMKLHRSEVDRMLRDAKQAAELKAELATYADRSRALVDTIGGDLARTYLGCCPARDPPKPGGATCPDGYRLERVIADMPVYE